MNRRPMNPRGAGRRSSQPSRAASGFTLIELMVAMLLGLIVIAGVVSVFLAAQQSYRTNQALGDVQDGSRIAFEMMARDIRDAGLNGCDNSGRVANVLNNGPIAGGTAWWADLGNAVHGYGLGSAVPDPALTVGSAATQQVAGTDSLQLLGAADSGLSVAATPSTTAANFKLNESTSDLQTGDVIIVCDPDHAAIAQITNYTSSTVTLVHNTGAGSPGNCSKGLGFPTVCTTNGNGYTFGANSQLAKLAAVDWYIGNYTDSSGVSGTSLYRMQLVTMGGTPTPTSQEMVRNVSGMTLRYHQPPSAGFVTAATVTNWALVDEVLATLTLQSTDQRAGTDTKPISRTFSATTTVRNRVN